MLAIATTTSLHLAEPQTLKRLPSIPPACALDLPPTCQAWSDNSSLILAQGRQISQYDNSGSILKTLHSSADGTIMTLVVKDRGNTVIFASGNRVHILDAHTGKVAQTFDTHKSPVTSLALSNDSTLLASTSSGAVHVHNLTHGAHTVLRGVPPGATLTTCAFHPHTRTRLLVAAGAHVLVYDTTRPSGPLKSISVIGKRDAGGAVVALASSPFSKTLVAAACGGGLVTLVDLEKEREKAVYKCWSVHVPITCVSFSNEGGTLYVGTENGKVIAQDLRSLERPPRSIIISESGDRVVAMSMQKRLGVESATSKGKEAAAAKDATVSNKPLLPQDTNKAPAPRAASAAAAKPERKPVTSPVASRAVAGRGTPSKQGAPLNGSPRPIRARAAAAAATATATATATGAKSSTGRRLNSGGVSKKVFSPPRSPPVRRGQSEADDLNASVRIETLLNLPVSSRAKENVYPAGRNLEPAASGSVPSISAAAPCAAPKSGAAADVRRTSGSSSASTTSRTRSSSGSTTSSGRASKASTRPTSVASSHTSPSIPPLPKIPSAYRAGGKSRQSLTPSPELPDIDEDAPITPLPLGRRAGKGKAVDMGVLGLGTPEVDRWIKAGQVGAADERGEGKKVGFANDEEDSDEVGIARRVPLPGDGEPVLTVQVSPARGPSTAHTWAVPSPLRHLSHSASHPHLSGASGSPNTRAAAGFLQTLLRDAMYEFRQETHGEIVGLHLDMLRMGRGLRSEMRAVVDEFRREVDGLREENRVLREENERLRRGF